MTTVLKYWYFLDLSKAPVGAAQNENLILHHLTDFTENDA